MTSLTKILLCLALVVLASNMVHGTVDQVPLPTINLTEWWGPGDGTANYSQSIKNFTIEFNETIISDLKNRLESHRPFVQPLEKRAFQYGFNSTTLLHLMKYLANKYPFQKRQAFLNQYSHFTTYIQGLRIHFIRVTSQNSTLKVVPLLILHGWPGSVREFYETIPYLISYGEEKGIAFDIIVPSLPGFGFSDGAVRAGLGVDKAAIVCRNLMHRIGHDKYVVQGGDIGSMIASAIATLFPLEVMGFHSNFPLFHTPEILFALIMGSNHVEEIVEPAVEDRVYPFTKTFLDIVTMTGYLHIQATKPDTVGIGLSDSPAGLMAYIMEKISSGFRKKYIDYPDGGMSEILTEEKIMDNYMIYWVTNCITTAVRIYADTFNKRYFGLRINEIRTPVPTWVLQAPDELVYLPAWIIRKKFTNLLHETLPGEGGHFYAWEKPKLFAEDVVNAVVAFNKWHAMNSTMYTKCSSYISN